MRIVIDMQEMVFLPIKCADLYDCANLAWIECRPEQKYLITTLDADFLSNLTDLEKIILYKNTTGETALYIGNKLQKVLLELANRIPERQVNSAELEMQATMVPEVRGERYLYNPGGKAPAIQHELFKLEGIKLPKASNEPEIVVTAAQVPPTAPIRVPRPTLPATPGAAVVGAHSAPRMANVAGVIWAVADEMWGAAGSPTDIKILLSLRRTMMDVLEEKHSIKRVTSSNELGRWMKTKL